MKVLPICFGAFVAASVFAAPAARAAVAVYEFGASGDDTDSDNYASTDTDTLSNADPMTRGSALGSGTTAQWPNPNSATVYITTSSDWRFRVKPPIFPEASGSDGDFLNDSSRAYQGNSYIGFKVTPDTDTELDLTSFSFDVNTANSRFLYYYLSSDIDGFDKPIAPPAGVEASSGSPKIDLPADEFTNLTSPVTFRLYVWGNQGGSSGSSWQLDTFTLDGTSSTVPEPASLGLLGLGAVAMLRRRRR